MMNKNNVLWVIDTTLLEGTVSEDLPKVVHDMGYKVISFSGRPETFLLEEIGKNRMPVVAYGTHRFIKRVRGQRWIPGAYPNRMEEIIKLSPIHYMAELEAEELLNDHFVFAPIAKVIKKPKQFTKMFNTNQLFIKETLTFKQFSGKVLKEDEIADYLSLYKDVEKIDNNSLVLLSAPKKIFSEHRFVIVSDKVIASSTYMMEGKLDIRTDVWGVASIFAQKIADKYSPCGAWTLDVAMEGETYETSVPKVLEVNSFSCAGLYACDLPSIIDAVSKRALDDYLLELSYHP